MRELYAARFELTDEAAFDRGQGLVVRWALDRYGDHEADTSTDTRLELSPTDGVQWANVASPTGDAKAWSFVFRHRDNDDDSLAWRSLVQLARVNSVTRVTFRLTQESLLPAVSPASDSPGRPRIVRTLVEELGGRADGRSLSSRARDVQSDDIGSLVDLLLARDRRLPVVVVSPDAMSYGPATDPNALADQLVGLAHVFNITTVPATFELTERLGRQLTVYEGAVRVYWPGLTLDSDPYLHRLWLGRTVDLIDHRRRDGGDRSVGFGRHLLSLIGDVASLRISPDPLAASLRREMEASRRAAERAEWERRASEETIPDAFAEEFDRIQARVEELELEKVVLEEEKRELEVTNERLLRNFADVQAAVTVERGAIDESMPQHASVKEALEVVASSYPGALVVLPEALDAAEQTRYRLVARASAAFDAIGQVAVAWREGNLGVGFRDAFAELGFDYRLVSEITQGRHRSDYERTYDGHRILLGPHLALGDGGSTDTILRIYWFIDEDAHCFVIGHAGRHLPDSTT